MIWRKVRPCVASRIASTSATKAARFAPALPGTAATLCARLRPLERAASCSCSSVRAPMPRVVADQLVGRIEDVAERAVVLLQLDDLLDTVLALEVGHVADQRAAEGVDALVVVADGEHALARARRGEHLQPQVLQPVGVLEL